MIVVILILASLLLYVVVVHYPVLFKHRGIQRWSVGIGRVKSVDMITAPDSVISHAYVKKHYGIDYIADPFIYKHDNRYFLFVEEAINDFGKIGVFVSEDLKQWNYRGTVIEEPEHMSYPQVFEHDNSTYMLPETKDAGRVSLYKATSFPMRWERVRDLIPYGLLDVTIINHNNSVYLFGVTGKYELQCFVSDDIIAGTFTLHPNSPLGIGEKMRPAGTPYVKNGEIIMPVQSRKKGYGHSVWSLLISELTPEKIRYKKGACLLLPDRASDYFKHGIHHLCIVPKKDEYIFAIDGRVGVGSVYWRNYMKIAVANMRDDLITTFRILKNNYL